MISNLFILMIVNLINISDSLSVKKVEEIIPQKASYCIIDLNNDQKPDIVFFIHTDKGYELIALIQDNKRYKTFLINKFKDEMSLSCHYGKSIKESQVSKGRIIKIPGSYIKLTQEESSSVIYFWNGHGFTEVWTSD
jgi:hypothetical protein